MRLMLPVLAAGVCIGALAPSQMAAAQTPSCKISTNSTQASTMQGQWYEAANVGAVATFGDLRVRFNQVTTDQGGRLVVDVKTPDFSASNITLRNASPQKFNACGAEITLTVDSIGDSYYLRVGVF